MLDNPPAMPDSAGMTSAPSPDRTVLSADALIVGGGMVGLTLAAALDSIGLSVAAVDCEDPAAQRSAPFDGRASAIAAASWRLLEALGLARRLEADAEPIRDIRVTDGDAPFLLHFESRTDGGAPFGFMVENRHFRAALDAHICARERVRLFAPDRVASLKRDAAGVRATLLSGVEIGARLAIAADGRASPTRAAAGIGLLRSDYRQVGVVATIAHERDHEGFAEERFLPAGPFAALPLKGRRSSLVWTETPDRAAALLRLEGAARDAEMRARLGDHLGEAHIVGPVWTYPLSVQLAERATDRRLALIGDALHGVHPIAGQGLNMGLRDVAALAESIADAARLGLDIGGDAVLERYRRWRRFDNALLIAVTDGLNRLFSNDIAPLRHVRSLGLGAVDRLSPLKRFFIRHAKGEIGDLPRLLRGGAL